MDEAVLEFGSYVDHEVQKAAHETKDSKKNSREADLRIRQVIRRIFGPEAEGEEPAQKRQFKDPAGLIGSKKK